MRLERRLGRGGWLARMAPSGERFSLDEVGEKIEEGKLVATLGWLWSFTILHFCSGSTRALVAAPGACGYTFVDMMRMPPVSPIPHGWQAC